MNTGLTDIAVTVLAIDPLTPSTVYAGTDGEVFQSMNGGASWTAVDTGLAGPRTTCPTPNGTVSCTTLFVDALAINPATPSTIYAGTVSDGLATSGPGAFVATDLACGDHVVEPGEECDDGSGNGTGASCCTATCTFQVLGTACTGGACSGTADTCVLTTGTTITTSTPTTSTTLPCTTARCTLGAALVSPACTGQTIPASVTGKLSTAETFIDQAATTSGKKARRVRQKARNLLRQAGAKATRAAKGKKATLSTACALAVKQATNGVRSGLGS